MRIGTRMLLAALAAVTVPFVPAIIAVTLNSARAPAQAPPPTLPASTVYGRLGLSAGPGQAIPFGTLLANLFNGASTFTAHSVLIGEGTSPVAGATTGTAGQLLIDQGSGNDPSFNALSGDCTITAGGVITCSNVTAARTGVLTNVMLATMANNTVKGNVSGGSASPSDLTGGQVGSLLCTPNVQNFTSGSSQTYTTPSCNSITATWLEVHVQGGGGGGGGSGTTSPLTGGTGNASSFGALTANGGAGGVNNSATPATGGTCSGSLGTQQNFPGSAGAADTTGTQLSIEGGHGGPSYYGGWAPGGSVGTAGNAPPANSGGGGGGGGTGATAGSAPGGGGGAGCHIWSIITSPAATYTYTVGGTAAGGTAGTSGFAGGGGAAGLITVVAHWQ